MGRKVNQQNRIYGSNIFNKSDFFLNIFEIFLHACITLFGSFSYLHEYIFNCLNMYDVNNSDVKDTGIASLVFITFRVI